jgi:hypothetical protein
MTYLSRLSAVALSLLLMATTSSCAAPGSGTPEAAEPHFAPAQLRADFDALYSGLKSAHYDLYARRSQREYDALYRSMRAGFDHELGLDEARLRFQRFAAYGRIAHENIDLPTDGWERFRKAGGKAFPLYFRVVDGRVYVNDDDSGIDGIAQGDEVLAVEGKPVKKWMEAPSALVSADNDYLRDAQMENRWPLLVWLSGGARDHFTLRLKRTDGHRVDLMVPARSRAEFTAAEAKHPPRFELDGDAREARMLDGGTAYLRPGPFYDNRPGAADIWDNSAFRTFLDQAFEKFTAAGAQRLLIDLRDNPGGDNSFSDLLVSRIADRPFRFTDSFEIKVSAATTAANRKRLDGASDAMAKRMDAAYAGKPEGSRVMFEIERTPPLATGRLSGKVFVLINRHSYSNTVLVAAIVQDYHFGTVMGEETSDLASTYGAMEKFTLANTGIEVGYPKARILRPSGNSEARGVRPDIAIPTPIVTGTDDTVLARALEIIAGRGS